MIHVDDVGCSGSPEVTGGSGDRCDVSIGMVDSSLLMTTLVAESCPFPRLGEGSYANVHVHKWFFCAFTTPFIDKHGVVYLPANDRWRHNRSLEHSFTFAHCNKVKTVAISWTTKRQADVPGTEYECVRAIRRKAQQNARRTKRPGNNKEACRARWRTRRYKKLLERSFWRTSCGALGSRTYVTRLWVMIHGFGWPLHQHFSFRALTRSFIVP